MSHYFNQVGTCNSLPLVSATISGWTIIQDVNLVESKSAGKGELAPFARLSARQNSVDGSLTDFLISIRGAQVVNISLTDILS